MERRVGRPRPLPRTVARPLPSPGDNGVTGHQPVGRAARAQRALALQKLVHSEHKNVHIGVFQTDLASRSGFEISSVGVEQLL